MEVIMLLLVVVLQLILYIFFLGQIIRSYFSDIRLQERFKNRMLITELLLTILLLICFANYEASSFKDATYFTWFTVLTVLSLIAFWLSKLPLTSTKHWLFIQQLFVACFFWLGLFTFIKFLPYLPWGWFPVLGVLATAPFFIFLMALSQFVFIHKKERLLSPIIGLLS